VKLSLVDVPFTLDKGFDSQENKDVIRSVKMKPVIHPNRRNTKTPIIIARMYRHFDRKNYNKRFVVERTYAWQDVYRKTVTIYERLNATRSGLRHLAYAMVNMRRILGKSL
jgi:transposase